MSPLWHAPFYKLDTPDGREVKIDVTSSVSASLPPHSVVAANVIPFLRSKGVETILDFGAGALRHTLPFLQEGFQVCSVEFEEAFSRPVCAEAQALARAYTNFSALIWPRAFLKDKRRFGAALLCYVLQTMPMPKERRRAIRAIHDKLRTDAYLLYMSRANQARGISAKQRAGDGYYMWPKRELHSFYREFTTDETHAFMKKSRFRRIRSLNEGGKEQIFLYSKGGSTWP
jgi:hypothetical protein